MHSQATERLEIIVADRGQLYELLNDAEAVLRQVAMTQRCAGILATRHDPGHYTFELSDTVPFGETWEQTLSDRRAPAAQPGLHWPKNRR